MSPTNEQLKLNSKSYFICAIWYLKSVLFTQVLIFRDYSNWKFNMIFNMLWGKQILISCLFQNYLKHLLMVFFCSLCLEGFLQAFQFLLRVQGFSIFWLQCSVVRVEIYLYGALVEFYLCWINEVKGHSGTSHWQCPVLWPTTQYDYIVSSLS